MRWLLRDVKINGLNSSIWYQQRYLGYISYFKRWLAIHIVKSTHYHFLFKLFLQCYDLILRMDTYTEATLLFMSLNATRSRCLFIYLPWIHEWLVDKNVRIAVSKLSLGVRVCFMSYQTYQTMPHPSYMRDGHRLIWLIRHSTIHGPGKVHLIGGCMPIYVRSVRFDMHCGSGI